MQEELEDRKASGWKDLWALCPSGMGVGNPSLCWRAEPGCPLPTTAGQAGSRSWGTHWVTAGHQVWDVQGRKGEEAQHCQSRASD